MSKKMKLNDLKVKSFIISNSNDLLGGTNSGPDEPITCATDKQNTGKKSVCLCEMLITTGNDPDCN